ncbi:MAG TPA: M20 family metallopeptidase [Acidimicrobiales bacterium]|nr:M20 family metallopeptidase [Acidimicrobiales bacterium]
MAGGTLGTPSTLREACDLLPAATELRRAVHAHPELGLDLPHTQQLVLEAIGGLGLEVSTGSALSSVVAVLEGGQPGPTTLLRADMDALPMPEDTGLPYSSEVEGVMHACGHDAHVAMLAGAAKLVSHRRGEVRGRVIFMFQPGEEGHAGARVMLEEGLLELHGRVDRAFALHITPIFASGSVHTRKGTMMASSDKFRVVVRGRGGHASMPHDTVDPIPVACEIVTSLQAMVTRRVPLFDPAVVTVARVSAGTTFNVVPEIAVLDGTVRALSPQTRDLVLERLAEVAAHIAAAHMCTAEISSPQDNYPVTVNDGAEAQRALDVARGALGPGRADEMASPLMGAEDWSYVLEKVPGCIAFLGAAPPGEDKPAPNHSNKMTIDEGAMAAGIAMYAAMALS